MGSLGFQHSRQIGVFLSGDEGVFLQVFHQHAESLFLSVLGRRRLETVCGVCVLSLIHISEPTILGYNVVLSAVPFTSGLFLKSNFVAMSNGVLREH